MFFVKGPDTQGVLREPSQDKRVILLLLSRALDDKPVRDVVTGKRSITDAPNRVRMALEITQFCHRVVGENEVDSG